MHLPILFPLGIVIFLVHVGVIAAQTPTDIHMEYPYETSGSVEMIDANSDGYIEKLVVRMKGTFSTGVNQIYRSTHFQNQNTFLVMVFADTNQTNMITPFESILEIGDLHLSSVPRVHTLKNGTDVLSPVKVELPVSP